jgi:hypothetical protein
MLTTPSPQPDHRKLLEAQRKEYVRFAQEADQVVATHDLRRIGLQGTANAYHDLVAQTDEALSNLPT